MKNKILWTIVGYPTLIAGAFTLGATVEMELIHYMAMILIYLGGYTMSLSHQHKN